MKSEHAKAAWLHTGAGRHKNRTHAVRKGRDRKVKHKGRPIQ